MQIENPLYKKVAAIIIAAILAIGIFLRFYNINTVHSRSPDEVIYTLQAKAIVDGGMASIKGMVNEYNNNATLWLYPPPIRIGFTLPLSALINALGRADPSVGVNISFISSVLAMLLTVVIGLRFFNTWITAYALLFLSVSPMDLAIMRRTWQDSMFGFVGLVLIYITCEITRNSRKMAWYIFFLLVAVFYILIKEPALIVLGLCSAWIITVLAKTEKPLLKITLFSIAMAAAVMLSAAILIHYSGGINNLLEVLRHEKEVMPTNEYIVTFQSAPWHQFLFSLAIISPLNAILFLTGIAAIYLSFKNSAGGIDERQRLTAKNMLFIALPYTIMTSLVPYCQNVRLISIAYAPFYLFAGIGFWWTISILRNSRLNKLYIRFIMGLAIFIIITAAVTDYKRFVKIFVRPEVNDASVMLIKKFAQ